MLIISFSEYFKVLYDLFYLIFCSVWFYYGKIGYKFLLKLFIKEKLVIMFLFYKIYYKFIFVIGGVMLNGKFWGCYGC